jgi:hypothetical protein
VADTPMLSVHMMVRNGEEVVERAIRSLGRLPDTEVVLVDCASTDSTVEFASEACADEGYDFRSVAVPASLFFLDAHETFHHSTGVSHSGESVLGDWARARNFGLDQCLGRWILKLDADDVCSEPDKLSALLLDILPKWPAAWMLACPYWVERSEPREIDFRVGYTRLWKNTAMIRFKEVCHENVDHLRTGDGPTMWYFNLADGPIFVDKRDCPERSVRPEHLYFKVLLREWERLEDACKRPSNHLVLYLAEEAVTACPELTVEVLASQSPRGDLRALCPADQAWAAFSLGRSFERLGERSLALAHYLRATDLGHVRSALYAAVLRGREFPHGKLRLDEAIRINVDLAAHYPRAASASEIIRARDPDCRSLVVGSQNITEGGN